MLPPDGAEAGPVRVALNREFNALVRAEQLDAARQPGRELDVLSFQNVQGQWLPKSLDLLNVAGRDKDRFAVTAAALNLQLAPALFDPGQLAAPANCRQARPGSPCERGCVCIQISTTVKEWRKTRRGPKLFVN